MLKIYNLSYLNTFTIFIFNIVAYFLIYKNIKKYSTDILNTFIFKHTFLDK